MSNFIKKVEQSWIDRKIQLLTGNDSIRVDLEKIFNVVLSGNQKTLSFLDIGCKVLIYGPPGHGKTAIAYELANKLKKKEGIEASIYEVDLPQLISSRMGDAAKNITELFNEINEVTKKYYVVILMDEIEVFFLNRENTHEHPDMNRAVAELMNQLDKASLNKNLYIIGLTNYVDKIDSAVRRRFSFQYEIEPPQKEHFLEFFRTGGFPIEDFIDDEHAVDEICSSFTERAASFDALKAELRRWFVRSNLDQRKATNFLQYLRSIK
ncbi:MULTISPECIES: ATP-binding protein [unclassified Pseudomonas]|uniref:ATP-binding protein n=1 Tax=unclassified Pseudomonas TaxID=196821 RepID=UPI001CC16186|nr:MULTISPECIES: ATP-binding protein [unclassified Pseudomonas]